MIDFVKAKPGETLKVKITANSVIRGGAVVNEGEVRDLSVEDAYSLIASHKAEKYIDPPAAPNPPEKAKVEVKSEPAAKGKKEQK